ncbi:alpha/beta hydrolase [Kiloniella antarctica]|uniref:Alpha/beta hydrolase n=1 Tax=Kiloniella antarctica TaxID=1550907 RepID=A0ABW5BM14_9PROT
MTIDPILEDLYNVRGAIPEFADIFALWDKRSNAFREKINSHLDLIYGTGPRAKLDIYPTREKGAALHVFIHGGYWQAMDKSQSNFLAEAFLDKGISVAMIGYDLCPDVALRDIVEEIRQGFAWLWHHADEYGYDRDRIQISGHSAGGHLVAILLTTDWVAYGLPKDISPIHSAIAISGLFDVSQLVQTSINNKLGLDFEEAIALSPLFMVRENICPLLLAVGDDESSAFHEQSDNLHEKWQDEAGLMERMTLSGHHHLSVVVELANPNSPLFKWGVNQLGINTKKRL